MVIKYGTSSIGMLTKAKEKNPSKLQIDVYFDQLMLMATNANFQFIADKMHMYISSLALLRTKLCMLQQELHKGSKLVYPEEMEARVCFQKFIIKEYMDTISLY